MMNQYMDQHRYKEVMKALDRAVPDGEYRKLVHSGTSIHQGHNYLSRRPERWLDEEGHVDSRVCSFNNTRCSREEIIAWLEEAILLARHSK